MSIPERRTVKAYGATKPGLVVEPIEYVSRPLGVEDVEIAISHCGICGSDLHTITGGWGGADYPVVPGHEIIGQITAIGPDVKHLQVGDRVGVGAMVFACQQKDTCKECATDMDSHCSKMVFTYNAKYADGEKAYGGYAEYVRVSGHYAFKIPEAIPSDAAAPLLCAGVTVYTPLQKHVKPGMRVGVVGIGGLGHLGLQFAKALGGVPVAFSQSPSKEQAARELGAEDFVVCSNPEAVAKAKRSVDVLLVTADAENQPWDMYISFIAVGGTLVLVGAPDDNIKFSPHSLIGGGVSFVGSLIGGIKDTVDMLKLAAEKGVRPVIQKLPMSKANEGIEMVDQGKVRYRVVLEN
jgi:D-arabinose 1-dehydrogenase-like Zn-dependent alcohol dehydrogenase